MKQCAIKLLSSNPVFEGCFRFSGRRVLGLGSLGMRALRIPVLKPLNRGLQNVGFRDAGLGLYGHGDNGK